MIVAQGVIDAAGEIVMETVGPLAVALVHSFYYRAEVRLDASGEEVAAGGIDGDGRFFPCELGEFFATRWGAPPGTAEEPVVLVVDLLYGPDQ